MVVATKHNQYGAGAAASGPSGLGTGDPTAAKRYIKALVQTGNSTTEGTSYDEVEVVRQTASLGTSELGRLLGAIAEELQTELTGRVNEEFEGFVSLFKDIGAMGEEESVVLADKVALIQALVHVPGRTWLACLARLTHRWLFCRRRNRPVDMSRVSWRMLWAGIATT